MKDIFAETLQGMLEAEMDNHLRYTKYDYKNKDTSNVREFELEVHRDRDSEFEPKVIKKRQTDVSSIEDQVIGMYVCSNHKVLEE